MYTLKIKKTLLPLIFVVTLSFMFISGCSNEETENKTENKTENIQQGTQQSELIENVSINLPTMQCEKCKETIETAVRKMDGIRDITVSVKDKFAHIDYEKSKIDVSHIEDAITSAGYDANDKKANPEAYENLKDCCKIPKDRKEKE